MRHAGEASCVVIAHLIERNSVNLHSDMLDIPEFFWEQDEAVQALLHHARQSRPSPIASRQAADNLFAELFGPVASPGDPRPRP